VGETLIASTGAPSLWVVMSHVGKRRGTGNVDCSVLSLAFAGYEANSISVGTQIIDLERDS
jgi:hypothetical protein